MLAAVVLVAVSACSAEDAPAAPPEATARAKTATAVEGHASPATPTAAPASTVTSTSTPVPQPTPTATTTPMPTLTPRLGVETMPTVREIATPTPTSTPTFRPKETPTPTDTSAIPPETPAAFFPGASFAVELALTPDERRQGLSDRESLAPGTGMLFVFAPRTAGPFWMLRMRFPIDMVWISENCAVADVTAEVPAPDPDTTTANLPTYSSSSPAGYVLEINAGKAAEYSIEAGVPVRFANVFTADGPACP